MYIILVYDVGEKRVGKVCKYMRRYLLHIQNSVFEGDLSEAKLEKMKAGLGKLLIEEEDSVLLWVFRDANWVQRQILGHEKNPISNII